MDEYCGIPRDHPESYHRYTHYCILLSINPQHLVIRYMFDNFFKHIDIDPNNAHILDGNAPDLVKECEDYERKIKESGGIELFVGRIYHNMERLFLIVTNQVVLVLMATLHSTSLGPPWCQGRG